MLFKQISKFIYSMLSRFNCKMAILSTLILLVLSFNGVCGQRNFFLNTTPYFSHSSEIYDSSIYGSIVGDITDTGSLYHYKTYGFSDLKDNINGLEYEQITTISTSTISTITNPTTLDSTDISSLTCYSTSTVFNADSTKFSRFCNKKSSGNAPLTDYYDKFQKSSSSGEILLKINSMPADNDLQVYISFRYFTTSNTVDKIKITSTLLKSGLAEANMTINSQTIKLYYDSEAKAKILNEVRA